MSEKKPIIIYPDTGSFEELRSNDILLTDLIKLNQGFSLLSPQDGVFEYRDNHLYFTLGTTRYQIDQQTSGSVSKSYVMAMAIALG